MNMGQKGFVNIAFIILIVILAGSGGFYIFKKSKPVTQTMPNLETKTLTATQTQNDSSSAMSTQDKTANWKIYKNAKYGIEFKYPSSLIMTEKEKVHPTGNSFNISFRESGSEALTVVIYLKNPTGGIDQSLSYLKTAYKDVQSVKSNGYSALRYLNNNNVIIFSGQKSYSFGRDTSNIMPMADFDILLSSLSIKD